MRIRPLTARLLVARGIAEADLAARFLAPRLANLRPPDGVADLPRAIERLAAALGAGETIGVFGDYDVDGVTTAAILTTRASRVRRRRWSPRAASRQAGYGLGVDDVARFAAAGCGVLVTGDCGTSDHEALRRRARARHRRDRHRSPQVPVGRDRRPTRSSIRTAPTTVPVQGPGVVRRGVLPGGRAAHAPAALGALRLRASCSTWSRWGRSPTWCRWSTRTASWSPPGCERLSQRKRPGWRALAARAELDGRRRSRRTTSRFA